MQTQIVKYCDDMKALLQTKNIKYGNSAIQPLKIFNKKEAAENILARLDDKLARIKNSDEIRPNDCYDLIGYIILLAIKENWPLPTTFID